MHMNLHHHQHHLILSWIQAIPVEALEVRDLLDQGLIGKLFVGALMLVGTLSSSVPHCPDPEDFVAGIGDCLDKTASSRQQ